MRNISCSPPPRAPEDLDGLSRYLYRTQGDADGLQKLEALLAGITRDTPFNDRSWTLVPLEEEDVAELPKRPGRPLKNLIASAVAYVGDGPLACHAFIQTMRNQKLIESTASRYDRESLTDPECFVAGTCDTVLTRGDAVRSTLVLEASFVQWKSFRFVQYGDHRAMIGRGWIEESSDTVDGPGNNQLWQSHGLDVWIDRGASDILRYQAVWTESDIYLGGALVDDDLELATVAGATNGIFEATSEFIRGGGCPF